MMKFLTRRWTLEEGPAGPRIVIPAPRLWPVGIFLGFWLCGWVAGEASALKALWSMSQRATHWSALFPAAFMVLWLVGWTAGGAVVWGLFLFSWSGREVLTLEQARLRVKLETVAGLGWSWRFELAELSPLRLEGIGLPAENVKNIPPEWTGKKLYHVALDSKGRKWKIGMGMEETTAKDLLHALRSRFGLPAAS